MARGPIPRENSLHAPEINNPFTHRIHLTTLDKIQIVFMSIFVVPLRIVFVFMWLVLAWFTAWIALYGRSEEEKKQPLSGWRNVIRPVAVFCARMVFWAGGFYWVNVKGKRVSSAEAPILATAPHSTYYDALAVTYLDLTSVVAKSSAEQVPFFGTLTRFTQPVFVSREDPNSRVNTVKEIRERAETRGKWPQIIIFTEGTCTNRTALISYKPGAFIPGVPVQPVCLSYYNRMNTTVWTWDGPGAFAVLWLTLCNFYTSLTIEYLPPYIPNEEEKKDAKLYGVNVRAKMAEALGIPVTDHTFEDCRLMSYAAKLHLPAASGLLEFSKISKKLGTNFDNLKDLLEKYSKVAQQKTGTVDIDQFAEYLGIPKSDHLEDMFALYDRTGSGTIDFREYVIGLHLVARPANSEDTIKFAFKLFDKGGKGYISSDELADILNGALGMEEVDANKLFAQINTRGDSKLTFDEFKSYAEEKPEYAKLFMDYQTAHELHLAESEENNISQNNHSKDD